MEMRNTPRLLQQSSRNEMHTGLNLFLNYERAMGHFENGNKKLHAQIMQIKYINDVFCAQHIYLCFCYDPCVGFMFLHVKPFVWIETVTTRWISSEMQFIFKGLQTKNYRYHED